MNQIWEQKCIISPSLITLDLCNLESQVNQLEKAGISVLHVDILDGHFSPSLPLGLETVKQLRKKTNLLFDVHLMATAHDYFVDEILEIGVQQLVFHAETEPHIDNRLNQIRSKGVRAGIALKPSTPLSDIQYVIEKCDTVLLMLINPGYASSALEKQVPYAARKITDLRNMINQEGLPTLIEIDGRISPENMIQYGRQDVDIFVAGSTCISRSEIGQSIRKLNKIRSELL